MSGPDRTKLADVLRRRDLGESMRSLACHYGVTDQTIRCWLTKARTFRSEYQAIAVNLQSRAKSAAPMWVRSERIPHAPLVCAEANKALGYEARHRNGFVMIRFDHSQTEVRLRTFSMDYMGPALMDDDDLHDALLELMNKSGRHVNSASDGPYEGGEG